MIYKTISGKLGAYFFQGCKGGGIQKKSLDIDWRSNHDPESGVIPYREAFKLAVSGKTFSSRAAMQEAIRKAIEEVHHG